LLILVLQDIIDYRDANFKKAYNDFVNSTDPQIQMVVSHMSPAERKFAVENDIAIQQVARLAVAYAGHIQRGDIPNPAPARGAEGYRIILNGVRNQVRDFSSVNEYGVDDADVDDILGARNGFNEIFDNVREMETIGEWSLREGQTWKDFGNRIKDPVTGEYRNHFGELMPTANIKDKVRWQDGKMLMYHASLYGGEIGKQSSTSIRR
jgi:hypothetical protein